MKSSVVNIEGVNSNAFGTGFVIDSNDKGVFILTCQHVLDDVGTPTIENVLAKVIAKGEFIDMAVLYVSKLHLDPLPLQTQKCNTLDVDVIGFSTFNQTLTQKKHIDATLYKENIELHSKEDDIFYDVHKIKAKDGFNFDRGNSGSPVICKQTGNVIAMVSNKEGSEIGYAIDIVNLKRIWEKVPQKLFSTIIEQPVQEELQKKETIEEVSGEKEEPQKSIEPHPTTKKSSLLRNLLLTTFMIVLGSSSYIIYDQYQQEEKPPIHKKHQEQEVERLQPKTIPPANIKPNPPHPIHQEGIKRIDIKETLPTNPRQAITYLKNNPKEMTAKKALKIAELYSSLPNENNNAIRWYQKAEELGYIKAKYPLAILYCKQGNYTQFTESQDILNYAKNSRKEFKYDIGLCYNELGNIEEARTWFEASTSMGYQPAKEALFIILTGELGFSKPKAKAHIMNIQAKE